MTRQEIKKRTLAIRAARPDVLEELFEQQNRICFLCGREIQDLMFAVVQAMKDRDQQAA